MKNTSREKIENRETKESGIESIKTINPMQITSKKDNISLDNYTQTLPRPKYDEDIYSILQTVKFLNNLAPKIMPEYNFNLSEINGETYYRPDGTLLLIREWDSDVVRDYYAAKDAKVVSLDEIEDKAYIQIKNAIAEELTYFELYPIFTNDYKDYEEDIHRAIDRVNAEYDKAILSRSFRPYCATQSGYAVTLQIYYINQ